jgi:PAS domain S-box-containing protein
VRNNEVLSQVQAQQALSRSEERFRLAAQAGRMYAFEWDVAKDIVERSPECADLLGAGEPTCGQRSQLTAKVHPDDRSQCDAIGMTPENPSARVRYRIMRSDGSFLWVEKTARAFFDPEGRMLRVTGMVADITDRIEAEDKMRASEERYRRIVETTREGIWLIDSEFRTSFVNQQMAGMLGYGLEEILGRSVFDFYFPEDIERKRKGLARRREGLVEHFDERLRRRDGADLWVRMAANPIYTDKGGFDGALAIVSDITEKKRAEQMLLEANSALERQTAELQAGQELLKIFVRNVPVGVAMLDRDLRYIEVSDRFCVDYSLDQTRVLGRSHYELFPDMPERWKQVHRRALDGETLRADEDPWVREGGTTWTRWEVRPWLNVEGLPGGIIIFAEDITRRKQTEQALLDVSRTLIESQERERTRIARDLHDDINQQLALLALELEELQLNPSNVESRAAQLRARTIGISSDVQALSRELHPSKLQYLGVIRGISGWCHEFAERQRMEIDFKADAVSTLSFEVGLCLFRVLQEAVHNSVKHSGTKRVEVQLKEHANEVHLTIEDRGKGFDIEEARQGRGLGLTSMQERVRLANGTIEIQSSPSSGTAIRVRLPIGSEQASLSAAG